MIDVNIIREQYRRMPDYELTRFAQNEAQGLTLESFRLLKAELELRNIGVDIIEKMQIERAEIEAAKKADFEMTTTFEFTKTIWEFAFNEKEKGVSNEQLFRSLTNRNINPEYAFMLINSIEPKCKEILDSLETEIIIGWLLVIAGGLLVLFKINSPDLLLIWGALFLIGGILRFATSNTRKTKFKKIIENLEAEADSEQTTLYQ